MCVCVHECVRGLQGYFHYHIPYPLRPHMPSAGRETDRETSVFVCSCVCVGDRGWSSGRLELCLGLRFVIDMLFAHRLHLQAAVDGDVCVRIFCFLSGISE